MRVAKEEQLFGDLFDQIAGVKPLIKKLVLADQVFELVNIEIIYIFVYYLFS